MIDIKKNIKDFGHHIYYVTMSDIPRYAYTIGLSEDVGYELCFMGSSYFSREQVQSILKAVASSVNEKNFDTNDSLNVESCGLFRLNRVCGSWADKYLFGAADYFKRPNVEFFQIVSLDHKTLDTPDMRGAFDKSIEPVWQGEQSKWNFGVSPRSKVLTNIESLCGSYITEASRWEPLEWEMFAGAAPDVSEKDVRVVPLATLIAIDPSLEAVTKLKVGESLWRCSRESDWQEWLKSD